MTRYRLLRIFIARMLYSSKSIRTCLLNNLNPLLTNNLIFQPRKKKEPYKLIITISTCKITLILFYQKINKYKKIKLFIQKTCFKKIQINLFEIVENFIQIILS